MQLQAKLRLSTESKGINGVDMEVLKNLKDH